MENAASLATQYGQDNWHARESRIAEHIETSVGNFLDLERGAAVPPPEELEAFRQEFARFCAWCDEMGLCALPAFGTTAAFYLLELGLGGVPLSKVEHAARAIDFSHEFASVFLDRIPIRGALAFLAAY